MFSFSFGVSFSFFGFENSLTKMATAGDSAAAHATNVKEVHVHPLVLASVVDMHVRRNTGMPRVVGAITGVVSEDGGVVEVTDCFPLSYTVSEEDDGTVYLDTELLQMMKKLRKRTAPQEQLLGWFSSMLDVPATSAIIHSFISMETTQTSCVMLCVDAASSEFKAYVSDSAEKPEGMAIADFFHEVPARLDATEMERTTMAVLCRADAKAEEADTTEVPLDSVFDRDAAFESLRSMVVAARECARHPEDPRYATVDPKVLAELKDVVARMEAVEPADVEKVFTENVTDILMIAYVTSLTKNQLHLAQRLRNDLAKVPESLANRHK